MSERICLLVDDEPAIRRYLKALLDSEHVQSLEAENAAQALSIVERLGYRLSCIVSDVKMPGEMDGLDLAHWVRDSFPLLPVILMSGYVNENCLKHDEFEFIQKPFGPETIRNAIRRAIS